MFIKETTVADNAGSVWSHKLLKTIQLAKPKVGLSGISLAFFLNYTCSYY